MVTRFSWCNDSVKWCISSWDTSSRSPTKRVWISDLPARQFELLFDLPKQPFHLGLQGSVGRRLMSRSASSINPRIAVSGVRSSWLTMRRNCCLRRSAALRSEMSSATTSARRRSDPAALPLPGLARDCHLCACTPPRMEVGLLSRERPLSDASVPREILGVSAGSN